MVIDAAASSSPITILNGVRIMSSWELNFIWGHGAMDSLQVLRPRHRGKVTLCRVNRVQQHKLNELLDEFDAQSRRASRGSWAFS